MRTRRDFIKTTATAFMSKRPPVDKRTSVSTIVDQAIDQVKARNQDPEAAWLFDNGYPNTLDTTVDYEVIDGKPDTFIITGDIDAAWLRDSTCQVWPYMPLIRQEKKPAQPYGTHMSTLRRHPMKRHCIQPPMRAITGALLLSLYLLPGSAYCAQKSINAWQAMRFGMFIHWGPIALKGTEIGWSRGAQVPTDEYDQLYHQFNPTMFNAREWVRVAREAGMKYVVITSKHHDGFCLWPSRYTDYHIGNTPFQRDVLKELSQACREQGLQFCTYYSVLDWSHPDYPLGSPGGRTQKPSPDMPRYVQYVKNQTREIIQRYGPLGIMWFDGEWEAPWTREYGNELYDYLKKIQPSLVINNRVSKGRQGMSGTTQQSTLNAGDYDTPEQRVGGFNRKRPWETCMTICRQWAWKPDDTMKSLKECVQTLLLTTGGDGNLLFNVGPMPDGRIESRQVERLREMGAWLRQYGEGVYGTRGGPFKPGPWGASTCKGNKVTLFVMNWPDQGPLELPALKATIEASRCLSGGTLSLTQGDGYLTLDIPSSDRHEIATVIELTVQGRAVDIKPIGMTGASGSVAFGKKVTASNTFMNSNAYGPGMAVDDDPETRWATDAGTHAAWLEVDLGRSIPIQRVVIDEPEPYQRVQSFELQFRDGQTWKTIHRGTTIGPNRSIEVASVTTRRVRINILEATDGPTINGFQLYAAKKE